MPTILILDRDGSRRERLVKLGQRIDRNIHIEAFLEAEPALAWLQWHAADLVICDHTLPRYQPRPSDPAPAPITRMATSSGADDDTRGTTAICAAMHSMPAPLTCLSSPIDDLEFHARCSNLLAQRRQQHMIHERACWLEQKVADATSEILQARARNTVTTGQSR